MLNHTQTKLGRHLSWLFDVRVWFTMRTTGGSARSGGVRRVTRLVLLEPEGSIFGRGTVALLQVYKLTGWETSVSHHMVEEQLHNSPHSSYSSTALIEPAPGWRLCKAECDL